MSSLDPLAVAKKYGSLTLGQLIVRLDAAESRAASAEAEVERLRKAIKDFLDGNYQHPRACRPGKCLHDTWYFEECGSCNDEHFANALAQQPKGHGGEDG